MTMSMRNLIAFASGGLVAIAFFQTIRTQYKTPSNQEAFAIFTARLTEAVKVQGEAFEASKDRIDKAGEDVRWKKKENVT